MAPFLSTSGKENFHLRGAAYVIPVEVSFVDFITAHPTRTSARISGLYKVNSVNT